MAEGEWLIATALEVVESEEGALAKVCHTVIASQYLLMILPRAGPSSLDGADQLLTVREYKEGACGDLLRHDTFLLRLRVKR